MTNLDQSPAPLAKPAPRVYVAGPYTKGDVAQNVRAAVLAADRIWAAGFCPFLPHLTHFWHLLSPKPYADWLDYDSRWLACCQYLVRLPGDSAGADREVSEAHTLGIPVFLGVRDFLVAVGSSTRAEKEGVRDEL